MLRSVRFRLVTVSLLLATLGPAGAVAEAKDVSAFPFAHRQRVAPFPPGLTWLNTAGPRDLSDFRGKFVLVDFWTYCCINCMHILPELKRLEHAYPNNLVVIGVHSAKFAAEQDSQNLSDAIQRYKIEHPVINDAQHVLWDRFGVRSWPTVMLVDPEGYAVWGASGEITFDQIDKLLKAALPYYRKRKLLDETPLLEGKGDSPHLCEAPVGPFRQMGTVPFFLPRRPRFGFPARSWPTGQEGDCSSPIATTTESSWPSLAARSWR